MLVMVLPKALKFVATACLAWAAAGCGSDVVYRAGQDLEGIPDAGAERPSFTTDDEFWFRTGSRSIIVEVFNGEEDGLLVFYRPNQREYRYYSRDLALVKIRRPFGTDRWFKPDDGRLSFPLKVGETWSRDIRIVSADGSPEVRQTRRCEVADAGEVEIPDGRFAAFRILCTLTEFGETRQADEEVFYAPSVGRIVLSRTRDRGIDLHLFEYTRAE